MSETEKYFRKVIESRINDIHTLMPCKVENYNESTQTAKVIPLYKVKLANHDTAVERPPILNVPVVKRKTKNGSTVTVDNPFYEPGDIVLVGFMERAYDMVRNGEIADPKYNRKHALEDAVIIGLL